MSDTRPMLAIVTGHLPPYREHFHLRIAREIPEVRLASLLTRHRTGAWVNPDIAEIGTVRFEGPEVAPKSFLGWCWNEYRKGRAVKRWLEEHRPDAVLLIGYHEAPNVAAWRWARRRRVPVMMWADSNIKGDLARGWKKVIKGVYAPFVCRRLSRVLVCGSAGEAFFRKYGVADEKMTRMPVEPDYSLIENMTQQDAERLAAEAGAPVVAGRRRLVCCCRLVDQKRVDQAIEAFKAIAAERPEWDLLIVGSGELREQLEARGGGLVRGGRIRFLGFQDQPHVTGVYRTSDVLVLTSDNEPWALVVNEAAAAGCALVTSDVVGASVELVREGVNGFMYPVGDLGALTDRLRRVTEAGVTDRMRAASPAILAEWRRGADPVAGLRNALRACGAVA